MFTGLIEATAGVLALDKGQLQLERPPGFTDIKVGSSIAVSGVCLTVTKLDQKTMHFQMVEETLNRSKLGSLKTGDRVNLERAMKDDGRLEGHKVQGHVEGVGKVVIVRNVSGGDASNSLSPPAPLPRWGGGGGEFFPKKPINKLVLGFAKMMRSSPTDAERELWNKLRRHQLGGFLFRRQHPIHGFILDFYCHAVGLGVEVDGGIHESQKEEDKEREEVLLRERGVRLIRFSNEEVLRDVSSVVERIKKEMLLPPLPVGEGGRGGEGKDPLDVEAISVNGGIELTLELPPSLVPYVIPKGSIALDGISLTIANIEGNRCTVALIPHTLAHTTLGTVRAGDYLNIETDMMVRAFAQFSRPSIA